MDRLWQKFLAGPPRNGPLSASANSNAASPVIQSQTLKSRRIPSDPAPPVISHRPPNSRTRSDPGCLHKTSLSCALEFVSGCCACMDGRPYSTDYSVYVDGTGVLSHGNRWKGYCPACKDYWRKQPKESWPISFAHKNVLPVQSPAAKLVEPTSTPEKWCVLPVLERSRPMLQNEKYVAKPPKAGVLTAPRNTSHRNTSSAVPAPSQLIRSSEKETGIVVSAKSLVDGFINIKPSYFSQTIEVWSESRDKAIPTVACLDTGSRGKDANLVAKNFVQRTLRVEYDEYPLDDRPNWVGLGGVVEPVGRIELKFFPINWEDDGTLRRDTPVYLTFYVLDGMSNFGDILLGREYCQLCAPSFHWSLKVDTKKTPAEVERANLEGARRELDRQRVAASRYNLSVVSHSPSQGVNAAPYPPSRNA